MMSRVNAWPLLVLAAALLVVYPLPAPTQTTEEPARGNPGPGAEESEADLAARYQAALERATETALYNQNRMLDEDLARLQPGDPETIDLFLLAVAGDGTQEVFRREVEFIRKRLDREFATTGRSLLLVNSHTTTRQLPLATTTSLERTLNGIAAIMDRDQDILFLYLTSHGSPEHELVIAHPAIALPDLPARRLAAMLERLPIKWKVIVISACYSGGFIEPLRDPHTLVMTAARHDRQSFGCTDEADMTYFGRAFFDKGLSEADSFIEAFHVAGRYIQRWEREFDQASLPQLHAPDAITQQLERWAETNGVFGGHRSRPHRKSTIR